MTENRVEEKVSQIVSVDPTSLIKGIISNPTTVSDQCR
ncbi:MAG: hypothetical protein K0R55_658 [Sporomusa sp.]|jgi:hypothetical protein|nr:hypothetical protein [Sporomusa sp.]